MATLEQITDRFRTAVGDDSGLGASVTFDLLGDGYIHIDGGAVTNENAPADCIITVSQADLEDIAQGRLDPTMAFMSGRLKVSDMGVAMKLVPLLSKAKG
jgi:putative sterol carrier protein